MFKLYLKDIFKKRFYVKDGINILINFV